MGSRLSAGADSDVGQLDSDEPMAAQDVLVRLAAKLDAGVMLDVGGTRLDVYRVTYDERWETFVMHVHPDDLGDAIGRVVGRSTS